MTIAALPREFKELPIGLIDDPALPSRGSMNDEKLDALVASIRDIGLQQPMIVARVGARFEIIAGYRRRIACERAGLVAAPCIVYASKDVSLATIQAHENSRREDLNPADEAIWFAELLERVCGGDIEKLCGLVGERLSYVDNRLALFNGNTDVFAALQCGEIKIGVAHELNKITDPHYCRYYLDSAIRGGATIALVIGWVQEWRTQIAGVPDHPAPVTASTPGIPTDDQAAFRCLCCRKADNVHLIRHVPIHQHCQLAILDPLLATYRGEA